MNYGNQLGAINDLDERLLGAFSKTSAIGFCILDNQHKFQFVNDSVVAMHNGISAEAFVGSTLRDILGDAALGPEVRLRQTASSGATPAAEITATLPSRTEVGYWIEKNFPVKGRSGTVIQIGSLAVEVTADRKLEDCFRKLAGERLFKNDHYQRLARELHDSVNGYHAALAVTLEHLSQCASEPQRIPELLARSSEFLDLHMRKLASAVNRCFPMHQQH